MAKILGVVVVAAAMLMASSAFAGGKACCAKNASNKAMCADLASLNLNADQKAKIEAWQDECMKAGCTKQTRAQFLRKAKGILSADQYAKLKEQCDKSAKKTEMTVSTVYFRRAKTELPFRNLISVRSGQSPFLSQPR
jgi:hypothetical protein